MWLWELLQMPTLTGSGTQGTAKMVEDGTRGALLPPARAEGEATLEESAVYPMRFPKISHAEITNWSIPQWFLLMFTSRMNGHSPLPETGNVALNDLPLSCLLFSSRAPFRQFFPSADVSTSHDLRWQPGLSFVMIVYCVGTILLLSLKS
jgi:hypothetical protein